MKNKKEYTVMRKFYNLGVNEVRIMDWLAIRVYAEVTYSELTEAIGLEKKMVSNVRKAVIHLQELKLICVKYKYADGENNTRCNPMKGCYIADNWMQNLMEADI